MHKNKLLNKLKKKQLKKKQIEKQQKKQLEKKQLEKKQLEKKQLEKLVKIRYVMIVLDYLVVMRGQIVCQLDRLIVINNEIIQY